MELLEISRSEHSNAKQPSETLCRFDYWTPITNTSRTEMSKVTDAWVISTSLPSWYRVWRNATRYNPEIQLLVRVSVYWTLLIAKISRAKEWRLVPHFGLDSGFWAFLLRPGFCCDFVVTQFAHDPLISTDQNACDRRFAKREMSGRVNANITFAQKMSGQVK